ncbi:MAG: methionyl-tRNA formyltransferase [Nocardioidaceae bacterium]|nr:methionyl-tRNA formyltransferase [Nocardioidaceae bacterium]
MQEPRAHDQPSRLPTGRPVGRVVLVGAVHESVPVLEGLLTTTDAELVTVVTGTSAFAARTAGAVDLAGRAASEGIPVMRTDDINAPSVVDDIARLEPDLLVVAGWTRLLGDALLRVPRRGCVGFHASLLPRHRGRAPVNWAIILGEREAGNTMMLLDAGVDTGVIVDQEPIPIGPDDTCATVYDAVGAAGARMLLRHLPALLAGQAPRVPQDPHAGDLLPKRTPEMGVLDWARSPHEVHDWVRALTRPYPGAFTSLDGERVWVWATRDPARHQVDQPPGTVLDVDADSRGGFRVATEGGSVVVREVAGAEEEPSAAAGWARARGLRPLETTFDPVPTDVSLWARGLGPRPTPAPVQAGVS